MLSTSEDLQESIKGEGNINDVIKLLADVRRTKEALLHSAVFIELSANSPDKLSELQTEVSMELTRETISVDRLMTKFEKAGKSRPEAGTGYHRPDNSAPPQ